MSQTNSPRFLLNSCRGTQRALDAFVVAARFSRDSRHVAFALGDGTLHRVALADPTDWRAGPLHDGAALALAAGRHAGRLRLRRRRRRVPSHRPRDGTISDIAAFGMKWVEQVASFADGKGKGSLLACAVGRTVHLFDAAGRKLKELAHPSAVTGLAFDAKGKRIGASHYNGASLWFVAAKTDSPRKLEWKGSHIGIAIHPDGDAVVTAMQENALHGWRLSDGQHMRMSGYPSKTLALSFTRNGKWLATQRRRRDGAVAVLRRRADGQGADRTGRRRRRAVPAGRLPPEGGHRRGGFADGLVVMADIESSRVLPVAPPEHGPVSALAWSPDGTHLAFGTESGFAAIVNFSKRQ